MFSEAFWDICLFLSAGDETQVNLAIVQASCKDSGVYGCTITNEYGTDSTDFLLSAESMYFLTVPYIWHKINICLCTTGPQPVSLCLLSHCVAVLAGMSLREDLGGKMRFYVFRSLFSCVRARLLF